MFNYIVYYFFKNIILFLELVLFVLYIVKILVIEITCIGVNLNFALVYIDTINYYLSFLFKIVFYILMFIFSNENLSIYQLYISSCTVVLYTFHIYFLSIYNYSLVFKFNIYGILIYTYTNAALIIHILVFAIVLYYLYFMYNTFIYSLDSIKIFNKLMLCKKEFKYSYTGILIPLALMLIYFEYISNDVTNHHYGIYIYLNNYFYFQNNKFTELICIVFIQINIYLFSYFILLLNYKYTKNKFILLLIIPTVMLFFIICNIYNIKISTLKKPNTTLFNKITKLVNYYFFKIKTLYNLFIFYLPYLWVSTHYICTIIFITYNVITQPSINFYCIYVMCISKLNMVSLVNPCITYIQSFIITNSVYVYYLLIPHLIYMVLINLLLLILKFIEHIFSIRLLYSYIIILKKKHTYISILKKFIQYFFNIPNILKKKIINLYRFIYSFYINFLFNGILHITNDFSCLFDHYIRAASLIILFIAYILNKVNYKYLSIFNINFLSIGHLDLYISITILLIFIFSFYVKLDLNMCYLELWYKKPRESSIKRLLNLNYDVIFSNFNAVCILTLVIIFAIFAIFCALTSVSIWLIYINWVYNIINLIWIIVVYTFILLYT